MVQVHRDSLVEDMNTEHRAQVSKLHQERTALKYIPNTMPSLRDGRGGGGWPFYAGHLLSTGDEKTTSLILKGIDRQRRSISLAPSGLSAIEAETDLMKMKAKRAKTSKASMSPQPQTLANNAITPNLPIGDHLRVSTTKSSERHSKRFDVTPSHNLNAPQLAMPLVSLKSSAPRPDHTIATRPQLPQHPEPPPPSSYHTHPYSGSDWWGNSFQPQRWPSEKKGFYQPNSETERMRLKSEARYFPSRPPPPPSPQRIDRWGRMIAPVTTSRSDLIIPPYNPIRSTSQMPPPSAPTSSVRP